MARHKPTLCRPSQCPQLKRKCVCYLYSCRNKDSFFLSCAVISLEARQTERTPAARINHLSISHVLDIKGHIFKCDLSIPTLHTKATPPPPPPPVPLHFPEGYCKCMENDMFKSTHLKALFCWSSVLNYCPLPGCSLPCSPMFSQARSLPLHVKLYTTLTHRNGVQNQQVTPGLYSSITVGGASGNMTSSSF